MIKNVVEISNLDFGGKAYGLGKLNSFGVPVPKAFAINQATIEKIIAGDISAINELQEVLNSFDEKAKFAIRSSAANEDGNEKSFAGMYESVLNVSNDIQSIIGAIQKVNESSSSTRIQSYNSETSKMNIVLQEMIQPRIAGVCFTDAIDLNGDDSIYIEYVSGLGESLVSGKKTAKSVVVSLKDYTYRCEDNQDKELFVNLIDYLKKIRKKTDEALDMEWCVTDDGKAFFVQARPITKQIIIREKLSTGAIASPGFCEGMVYKIDEDADDNEITDRINNFPQGAVLIAKTTDTNYVPAMKKASGIITTEGSVLSHAAIIAREFGIPCITGYKEAFRMFNEGNGIIINTNQKNIVYNGKNIAFGSGKEINLLELYDFNNIIEERINGNLVLVESVNDEFGIHISEELSQEEIDQIEIFIRKKYKKNPIILADQKFLWYTEFKRYKKFPNYQEQCDRAHDICYNFDGEELDAFVSDILDQMEWVYNNAGTEYEMVYAGEYAQALHFLINLYMCNGCAMKSIYDYINNNGISTVQELLLLDSKQSKFLKKIAKIRETIWGEFVKKGWSSDEYYDDRDEKIASVIGYDGDVDNAVDEFYKNLKCPSCSKIIKP